MLATEQAFEILDAKQLAERWRVSRSWIIEHTRRRCTDPIPHVKLGRYVRFEWQSPQLARWWAKRRS